MDKNGQIDQMIKIALHRKAQEVQVPMNMFSTIRLELDNPSKTKHPLVSHLHWRVVIEVCAAFILCCVLFLAFSKEARVMAADVLKSIKKVFVVEKVDNNYRVFEKPVDEIIKSQGICKITDLTDNELSQKTGYKVCFPTSLDGGYQLDFKVFGVRFDTININTFQTLHERILLAIDDDQEFEKLKIYKAKRYTGAFYKKDGNILGIYILEKSHHPSQWTAKPVVFDNRHGLWYEYPHPSYFENSTAQNQNIQIKHALYVEIDGLGYHFRPEGTSDFPWNEVSKIAGSFLKRIETL